MKVFDNIPVWGNEEPEAVQQMKAAMLHEGQYCALMADHHVGYSIPVGGVIAYEKKICVNGVGYDIACGNKAVCLALDPHRVKADIYRVMNEIQHHISFGMGGRNKTPVESELFDEPLWEEIPLLKELKTQARAQLGTVGGGNHYVDIFLDEFPRVWVGVHFGSRGLGHRIATHFVKAGGGKDGVHAEPVLFDEESDLGEQYLKCMELAGKYAYEGRDWVCNRVAKILRSEILEEVHNHHNFAWKENHFDKDLWVVRKGATPAFPGQKSFVGGSMGDKSFILEGKDSDESKTAMYSTVHGAGRKMGRTQAKGKYHRKTGECIKKGLVDPDEHAKRMKEAGVELRGGGLDESPFAYKNIDEVILAHKDTIEILHELTPIGVCMAGEERRR